jgi:hypothetical protein
MGAVGPLLTVRLSLSLSLFFFYFSYFSVSPSLSDLLTSKFEMQENQRREHSYSSQNSARAMLGPLLTVRVSLALALSFSFFFLFSVSPLPFPELLTSNSEMQEDKRREQLQGLMARMRRPEANLDDCDQKRPFHHAYHV